MVEHLLAKEKVAGSNPVFRSIRGPGRARALLCADLGAKYARVPGLFPGGRGGKADAAVLKTAEGQPSCGFESRRPHQKPT